MNTRICKWPQRLLSFVLAGALMAGAVPFTKVAAAGSAQNLMGDPSFDESTALVTKQLGNDSYDPGKWYTFAGPVKAEEQARTGQNSIKIPGTDAAIEQDISGMIAGREYVATVWAKLPAANQSVYFGVKNYGGNELKAKLDSTEYKQYVIPFTYTGNKNTRLYIWAESLNAGAAYADDFSLVLKSDIDSVSMDNGAVEVVYSDDYAGVPDDADFSLSYVSSIDPDSTVQVPLTGSDLDDKTLTLEFDAIAEIPVAQDITMTLTYAPLHQDFTDAFTVDSNGQPEVKAAIDTISATNGQITLGLDQLPTVKPKATDFTVQYSVNGGSYTETAVTAFSYDSGDLTVLLSFAGLPMKQETQNVTVKVLYNSDETTDTFVLQIGDHHTYYVDATAGNDANDGLTEATAWKSFTKVNATTFNPGDQILFKRGETWTGELMPKGSGIAGAPIVIASYGNEADGKPIIMPGPDRVLPYFNVATDVLRNKKINNTISFYNQEHWEIRDLELYDPNFETNKPTYGYQMKDSDVYRRAINLMAEDAGDLYGFTIDNVTMHGFRGPNSNRGKSSGGVIITILSDPDNAANRVPTGIHDITVTNCEMYNLGRSGFNFSSPWTTRYDVEDDVWGLFGYAGYGDWYPCRNIYIANNILHDIDGDGILIDGCEDVLVEHNVVYRTMMYAEMAVGIFNWNSDNTVFQYNEVYDICPSDYMGTTHDAQGIEIDALNRDTLVQYNYTHDNRGGTFMWCSTGDLRGFRGIYRYNISQNDGNLHGVIDWRPNHVDSMVYNNTVFIGGQSNIQFLNTNGGNVAQNPKFFNNIFYNENPNLSSNSFLENQIEWKNNIFYGFNKTPADTSNLSIDPMLVAAGTGGNGMDSVDGYKLQAGSPAIDAGMTVTLPASWYNFNSGKDYFGTALTQGKTDIGAAEFASTVRVTFDTQGGSAVASQDVAMGGKITQPANPAKADYTFAGWYLDAEYVQAWDFNDTVDAPVTLIAKWTANPTTPVEPGDPGDSGSVGGGSTPYIPPVTVSGPNGVSVQVKDSQLPAGVTAKDVSLSAELQATADSIQQKTEAALEAASTLPEVTGVRVFDINLLRKNGEKVPFTGKVKVQIPVENMSNHLRVFYVSDDGAMTEVAAVINGSYIEFEVEHFSYYAVVDFASYAGAFPVSLKTSDTQAPAETTTGAPATTSPTDGNAGSNPRTGMVAIPVGMIVAALAGLAVSSKKRA